MRRDLVGVLIVVGILLAIPGLVLGWMWLSSSGSVEEVRALEDRAIGYIERFRAPELELRGDYPRIPERDIRLAAGLTRIPGGDLLAFWVWGGSGPPWEPGRGVWVTARFRSSLDERETCHLLARAAGKPPSACVAGRVQDVLYPGERTYELDLEGEGIDGFAEVHLRRLRDSRGVLQPEFSVVAELSIRACGTERSPGTGPCP